MLCSLFRSKISAGTLSSVRRIYARSPINSNVSLLRGYATRRPPPIPNASRPPPRGQVFATRPPPTTDPDSRLRKIQTAERLFKTGDKILYKSTRRITLFRVNSWVIATVASIGGLTLYSNGYLDIDVFRQMDMKHPGIVAMAYVVTCCFFGIVGGLALRQARYHIHSIEIIQQSGRPQLQVTVRSLLPFMRKRVNVETYDFVVNSRFAAVTSFPESLIPMAPSESSPSAFTAGVLRESLKFVSRLLYSIFDGFRTYLISQGLYNVEVIRAGKNGKQETMTYKMDAAADYLLKNDKPVLWDVIEMKDPWDY